MGLTAMAKIDLPYVHAFRKGGRWYHYYRCGGRKVRLRGEPMSEQFLADYRAALSERPGAPARPAPGKGSLGALVLDYYASPEWTKLGERTKKEYRRYLERLVENHGAKPWDRIEPRHIYRIRDEMAATPRAADFTVQVLSIIGKFAVKRGYRSDNPAKGVELLRRTTPYEPWPDHALERFHEETSLMHRLAFMIALYTGQRRSDQVRMGWPHYDGTTIEIRPQKTYQRTRRVLWIPAHSALRAELDKLPRDRLTFLVTSEGKGFDPVYYGAWFKEEMVRLGLGAYQLHGLRKNAVNALLEAGCSEAEVSAIVGMSLPMVAHYGRDANRRRLARTGMARLES